MIPGRLFILVIRVYQLGISPLLSRNCRFYPSCSQYAIEVPETKRPSIREAP